MSDEIESALNGQSYATLDPPGSIAVVGAGPLGIEAALYGRFLGYDVTLFESEYVGHSMREKLDQPLPALPNRCLSRLAIAAVQAQKDASACVESPKLDDYPLPLTYREWIDDWLVPLTETDLLSGRLRASTRVVGISTIPVSADDMDSAESDDKIPDDFRLRLIENQRAEKQFDAETVIVTVESLQGIDIGFPPTVDYFFHLSPDANLDIESRLREGFRLIVRCYSILAGRADLDLYRPRRGTSS